MKVVLDTNILLVSISPKSEYHWVFQKFLNEEYTICVTTDILHEYEEIIGAHMGEEVANYVLQILENSVNIKFVTNYFNWQLISADPDDNKFVDCAISCNAKYLVTQDKHFNILKNIEFPRVEVIDVDYFKKVLVDRMK